MTSACCAARGGRWVITLATVVGVAVSCLAARAASAAAKETFPPVRPATVYTRDNAPAAPKAEDLPLKETVSMYGITWTFEKKVPVGQFVNGEFYVVGPVKVVAIDPKPVIDKDVPEDQINAKEAAYLKGKPFARNGSMLNLLSARDKAGKLDLHVGFDSRIRHNWFEKSAFRAPPIGLKPGDALVSSISMNKGEKVKRIDGQGGAGEMVKPTKIFAVLTCLADPVPADAFRPSYADRRQKIYLARDLRRELLPSMEPSKDAPPLEQYVDMFQRPWTDVLPFTNAAAIRNMPQYGREVGRHAGLGALLLCLNYKPAEKEALLDNYVQVGIDLWGVVRAGYHGWPATGGHAFGRKLPIVLAGWLFNDEDMMNPYRKFPNVRFGEDMQTMYGDGWTGAKALYAGHAGLRAERPDGWGNYEHLTPDKWIAELGEGYRRCCTASAWVNEALAMRLLKMEKVWNHDAFFDYCDRWMFEDDSAFTPIVRDQFKFKNKAAADGWYEMATKKTWAMQGQTWDPFVDAMWAKYRTAPGMPPTDGWKTKKPNRDEYLRNSTAKDAPPAGAADEK